MTTSFPKASYGLGCQLLSAKVTLGAGPGLGHGGSIFGYQTQATAFPDAKLAIVSIAGDSSGDPNGLSIVALDAFATLRAAP